MSQTIVICPGGWPLLRFFQPLLQAFNSIGYSAECKIPDSYPDWDPSSPPPVNPDATFLRNNVLIPIIEEGKDVALFMHSYGGAYGPAALQGLSKKERQSRGLPGGVVAAVFTAAFVVQKGISAASAMGINPDNIPEWLDEDVS